MSTDGVAVSITMIRKSKSDDTAKKKCKKRKKIDAKQELPSLVKYSDKRFVAVDPGAKLPLVTAIYNEDGFAYKRLSAGRVFFESGEWRRERVRRRVCGKVDEARRASEEAEESKTGQRPSTKRGNDPPAHYTAFVARHFDALQSVYERRTLRRLKFDKYTRHQRMHDRIVDEYFGEPDRVILYGNGVESMNCSPVYGRRKFSHDRLLAALRRRGRNVVLVDESYTTKQCAKCHNTNGSSVNLFVATSPHRYVHCPVCHTNANRDENAAANILLKSLAVLHGVKEGLTGVDANSHPVHSHFGEVSNGTDCAIRSTIVTSFADRWV